MVMVPAAVGHRALALASCRPRTKATTPKTGCEIDFHFIDDSTAEIGLNDRVYTLKKQ